MSAGSGIISPRKTNGNATARSIFQPAKNRIIPPNRKSNEERLTNNSAPSVPASKSTIAPSITGGPKLNVLQLVPALIQHVTNEQRHDKPVAVVRVLPPLHHHLCHQWSV